MVSEIHRPAQLRTDAGRIDIGACDAGDIASLVNAQPANPGLQ
jgi:hypothetical protein